MAPPPEQCRESVNQRLLQRCFLSNGKAENTAWNHNFDPKVRAIHSSQQLTSVNFGLVPLSTSSQHCLGATSGTQAHREVFTAFLISQTEELSHGTGNKPAEKLAQGHRLCWVVPETAQLPPSKAISKQPQAEIPPWSCFLHSSQRKKKEPSTFKSNSFNSSNLMSYTFSLEINNWGCL